jgi:hypothetical protein
MAQSCSCCLPSPTLGFRESDPGWHVDALLALMRTLRFDLFGSSRTYWDLFVGEGLTVGLLYLPTAFASLTTLCLIAAAWLSAGPPKSGGVQIPARQTEL